MSSASLASVATSALGFPVEVTAVSRESAVSILEHQLDPSEASLVLDLLKVQTSSNVCSNWPTTAVQNITGRNATDIAQFFRENAASFRPNTTEVAPTTTAGDLDAALLELLEATGLGAIVRNNSLGFWVSVRTPTDSINAALGYSSAPQFVNPNSTVPPTPAETTDIVPAGSLTKSFTAAAIMRLVEAGEIGINDTALPLANKALQNWGETYTLEDLYPPQLANATIKQLLAMETGIMEYYDPAVEAETDNDPLHDITPQEYLTNLTLNPNREKWRCGNDTTCDPPMYCSMGYLMLTLVLAGHTGVASWETMDQRSLAIPPEVVADPNRSYNDSLLFFKTGPCSAYPRVAHYYDYRSPGWEDLYDASCLNGWGFGNVGASAAVAADFFFDLVGRDPRIVDGLTALQMQQWGGVLMNHHTERYGLGLMYLPLSRYGLLNDSAPGAEPYSFGVGHNGCDYGTYTHNIYLPSLNAGISMMMSRDELLMDNGTAIPGSGEELFCLGYKAIFHLLMGNNTGDFDIDTAFVCSQQ